MGDFILPMVIATILIIGLWRGVPLFDLFLQGAKEGLQVAVSILPALVALVTCVGMFKASGGLDLLTHALGPLFERIGLPQEVMPLALLRPISGSGALVIFEDILKGFGADSMIGRIAAVMMGSTETTFYTIAVYYSAAGIRKTGHTLPAALTADVTGFLASAFVVRLFFGGR